MWQTAAVSLVATLKNKLLHIVLLWLGTNEVVPEVFLQPQVLQFNRNHWESPLNWFISYLCSLSSPFGQIHWLALVEGTWDVPKVPLSYSCVLQMGRWGPTPQIEMSSRQHVLTALKLLPRLRTGLSFRSQSLTSATSTVGCYSVLFIRETPKLMALCVIQIIINAKEGPTSLQWQWVWDWVCHCVRVAG